METRIEVKNELESQVVQEQLFEMGYHWVGEIDKEPRNTEKPYLFIKSNKEITWGDSMTVIVDSFESITFPDFVERFIHELPKKWCIRMDKQEVVDWCNVHGVRDNYFVNKHWFAHFPPFGDDDLKGTTSLTIEPGYKEITYEQFKKFCMKENVVNTYVSSKSSCISGCDPAQLGGDCTANIYYWELDCDLETPSSIFNTSSLLSLNFNELISLRGYYEEEMNKIEGKIKTLKLPMRHNPTEAQKSDLSEAEVIKKGINEERKEVKEAIKKFIENLKR
ncbi:MAG: hypothetical protein ACOC2U_00765 [bacterium]